MDWTTVTQNWGSLEQAILTRWPEADPTEVAAIDGDRGAFNAYLGRLKGLTPREADLEIDEWMAGPFPSDAVMNETQDNAQILASAAHIPAGEDVYSEDRDFGDDRLATNPVGRD